MKNAVRFNKTLNMKDYDMAGNWTRSHSHGMHGRAGQGGRQDKLGNRGGTRKCHQKLASSAVVVEKEKAWLSKLTPFRR